MSRMPEYTEGVCGDGAALLCDGIPMSIPEILAALNRGTEAARERGALRQRVQQAEKAALVTIDDCKRQGVSFGRILANDAASMYLDRLTQTRDALVALVSRDRGLVDAGTLTRSPELSAAESLIHGGVDV